VRSDAAGSFPDPCPGPVPATGILPVTGHCPVPSHVWQSAIQNTSPEPFQNVEISPIRAPIASFHRRIGFRQRRCVHRHFYLPKNHLFFKNNHLNQRKNCSLAGFQQAPILPHILSRIIVPKAAGSPLLPDFNMVLKTGLKRLNSRNNPDLSIFSVIYWSPVSGFILCFRTEAFWYCRRKTPVKK